MSADIADAMLLDASSSTSLMQSALPTTNRTQDTGLSPTPQTPSMDSTAQPEASGDDELASTVDNDVVMPDEAALAAAAAAMAAAAQGHGQYIDQHQPTEEAMPGGDDLGAYLLSAAAAAASVHAQQQINGEDRQKAQSEESFDSSATPVHNSVPTNGASVNGSDEDDARAAVHEKCRKYTGDSAPYPLAIGKRTPGGSAELLADCDIAAKELDHLPLIKSHVELGKTRCYWALLSANHSKGNGATGEKLHFVYLDPILQQHMAEQAQGMIGSDFYDYVHPEERDRVSDDMQKIVESRTLFGSVTRCRYSRVPRIRELLGAVKPPRDPDADRYVEDENFVAIDIVINWIGDNMLLCFFHAIIDKGAEDNDEEHKSDWTNWCGTPPGSFTLRQCDTIWKQVKARPREIVPESGPVHVFQVIEAGGDGRLLLSWPPPRLFSNDPEAQLMTQSDKTVFRDGSYFADDFARLAQGVSIAPGSSALSDANTSCTRRFRAKHTLTTEGKVRSIESVLIPYGGVILACFHTTFQQQLPQPDPKMVLQARATLQAQTERRKSVDDAPQGSPNKRVKTDGSAEQVKPNGNAYQAPASPTTPSAPTPPTASLPKAATSASPQMPLSTTKAPAVNGFQPPSSHHSAKAANVHTPKPPAAKYVKPAVKSESSGLSALANPSLLYANAPTKPSSTPANSARPATTERTTPSTPSAATNGQSVPTPAGDSPGAHNPNKACTGCGKVNSPEWRRGPSGHKTLCNACGLRYARSLTRRKKKKGKDGAVEFIEPTGDPSVVPKSRGGGGGSLPGVHRKDSKKKKEEEGAKAAAAGGVAATQASSTASPSSTSATQSPTPAAMSASPAKEEAANSTPARDTPAVVKAEPVEPKTEAVNGALPTTTPASADAAASADPAQSLAVSIALGAISSTIPAAVSADAETLPLPVSNAISRAIAATIGSTSTEPTEDAAAGSLLTSLPSAAATDVDSAGELDSAVSAAALKTIESVVSEALFKDFVSDSAEGKTDAVAEPPAVPDASADGMDLSHALTADAIRAAAQAAIAQGVAAAEDPAEA
ncbi:uncharacterized protein UDID_01348 [Ustilago sp. UG-2017a]|nr:uncharacterized protein UDID_01348 [Ustilago sp. UG-2017a]